MRVKRCCSKLFDLVEFHYFLEQCGIKSFSLICQQGLRRTKDGKHMSDKCLCHFICCLLIQRHHHWPSREGFNCDQSTDVHMPASVQNSFLEQLQWHLRLMSWPFELGTNSTLGNHFISVLEHSRPPEESLYVRQGFGHTKMISNSQLFMGVRTCDRGFLPLLPAS
ncbi:DNA-directed RNA polymerase subunit alpha [Frankliniella fusca]|uniref:DNA-directed RNA polymerase subunit alpha n=1 Tax=Frankliniella fusca TaxID=407009 RepID=A0AAE1HQQ8_9NEOP|nr:DNA-directed RNA polymerase subunit alpha [Frankliniella fusca]